jgi:hypothetical protein
MQRKALGVGERVEELALLAGQQEHRHEGQDDDQHREEHRPADLRGGLEGVREHLRRREAALQLLLGPLAVADDIFRHHDARVHQHADGDGDAGERHDVRGDAEPVHQDERNQDGGGQRQRDDEDAAEVEQEQDVRERHENDLLGERVLERVDGAADEVAAVVEGFDGHAGREARGERGEAGLHVLNDLPGVLAVAHDDNAADDLPAVDVEGAAAEVAADAHGGDIAQEERRAVARLEGDGLKVGGALHEADAAHDVFGAVFLNGLAADVPVAGGDGVHDFAEHHAVLLQLQGGDLDLPLAHEAAEAGDLGHARHGGELVAHEGVLQRAERTEVLRAGLVLEVVLVDPAEAGGVGPRRAVTLSGRRSPREFRRSSTRVRAK